MNFQESCRLESEFAIPLRLKIIRGKEDSLIDRVYFVE